MPRKTAKKTEPRKTSPRARRGKAREATSPEIASEKAQVAAAPSLEQIRDRAYQIFRRGVNPRDPVADWLQAERELSGDPRA